MQRAVKEMFESMREPWWDVIDANRDEEVIEREVLEIALGAIERAKSGEPLGTLWDARA